MVIHMVFTMDKLTKVYNKLLRILQKTGRWLLIFAPIGYRSLLFFCRWLCLSASLCLSGCPSRPFKLLFFVSGWNRAIFWPTVLHVALYKTLFFDFWFRPVMPEIYSAKFLWHVCDGSWGNLCTQRYIIMSPPVVAHSAVQLCYCYRESRQSTELRGRPLLPWQRNLR